MRCLKCDAVLDANTHLEEDIEPKDGDFSVCLYCGEIMVFEGDHFRTPNDADLQDLEAGGLLELQKAQQFCRMFHEKHG